MPSSEKMQRVSKVTPCPVCGKPDWCLTAGDGSAAICARIEQGSAKKCGDAGWLHILQNNVHNVHDVHRRSAKRYRLLTRVSTKQEQTSKFEQLVQQYQQLLTADKLNMLSDSLGVSVENLKRLSAGWDGQAYTFGMSNAKGQTIGIRRRSNNGRKRSIAGSKTGLFIPSDLSAKGPLLIVEGPTDTAAALDLGFDAIGRPNCNSKVEMTVRFARGRNEVVIIGDNDTPGRNGTGKLVDVLVLHCQSVKVIFPPEGIKDLRQWLQRGLTRERLNAIISKAESIRVTINFKTTRRIINV